MLIWGCFLMFIPVSFAQITKDTMQLKMVDIAASRMDVFSTGSFQTKIDSTTRAACSSDNLATLCKRAGNLFIKDYGAGGIATASVRGTSSTHTGILWNGFLLNAPNLGLADLSLIPVGMADEITICEGGNSALYGNASLGGTLALENKPLFFRHGQITYTGSYANADNYHSEIEWNAGNNRFSNQTQVYYQYQNNRYTYINEARKGKPEEVLEHARVINYGLKQQMAMQLNRNQHIMAGLWYQVTGRQQPPLMTSTFNQAFLNDSCMRGFLSYEKKFLRSSIHSGIAYFDETERYDDDHSKIHSTYRVKSMKVNVAYRTQLHPKLILETGMNGDRYEVNITEYGSPIRENRAALFAGLHYKPFRQLAARLNIRKELVKESSPPVVASAGLEYSFFNELLVIKANGGTNYNLPSLNDQYWEPGGNRNIKPESAWNWEAGFVLSPDKKHNLHFSCSVYEMWVNNWIQWYPADSTGLYKALNLKKVFARGLQSSAQYKTSIRKVTVQFSATGSYTRSTSESVQVTNAATMEGMQLIYIPLYTGNLFAEIAYGGFVLSYYHSFTGKRYYTTDNVYFLEPFSTGHLAVSKSWSIKKQAIHVFIKIDNLWNEQYQEVKWHAMPLRCFRTGLTIDLNYLKTQQK